MMRWQWMITFPRQEFKRTNRVELQAGGRGASVRHEVDINDTSTSNQPLCRTGGWEIPGRSTRVEGIKRLSFTGVVRDHTHPLRRRNWPDTPFHGPELAAGTY